jgi:hypothetical protein
VLDGPANNAFAHFLHSMLYVLGEEQDTSARPVSVVAELYRANDITNYDTAALRCRTDNGAEVLLIASHAIDFRQNEVFHHTFEDATAAFTDEFDGVVVTMKNGARKTYSDLPGHSIERKLAHVLYCARTGEATVCGIEAARAQTLCINGAQESMPEVVPFPKSMIKVTGEPGHRITFVPELGDALKACYREGRLPSEMGFNWAKPGREIDLTNYTRFPTYVDSFGG